MYCKRSLANKKKESPDGEPSGDRCMLGNYLKYFTAALNIWMS